jgi:GrpB-like predicted nucleotidyltransferase (UPF0157 family)
MKIQIVHYNASWPREFNDIANRLRDAIGGEALTIHHIGSTSVPGLAAKDIIDLQVGVADLSLPWRERIEALGFEYHEYLCDHCPPGMDVSPEQLEKRFFGTKDRAANVHIRVSGRFNYRYALLFRDYLRTHHDAANAYGAVKEELARHFHNDEDSYYGIKDPVCDCLMSGALEWARFSNWIPGPSDA